MTASQQGTPCWYELMTTDLDAAQAFYGPLMGWTIASAGMPGFDYRLANIAGSMVAGLWAADNSAIPPSWLIYFAVDDADATAAAAKAAGGQVYKEPADIPGTGRFAVLGDPQGAAFGILQPLPGGTGGAFDQQKPGHGNWNELRTPDPAAALTFYGALFGWTESRRMDMGPMGNYHLIAHQGTEIGGTFGPGGDVPPHWLPYFGTPSANAAIDALSAGGGKLVRGPDEVPGGAFTVQATDPQGAHFAVVGPK
ncbi:MAG: VOC family protein [Rhodobacteraceae bacterium]|nr:VOC family protein [Paracoccaceae bacterium]